MLPHCDCGFPSVLRTAQRDGPHWGRRFFRCALPEGHQCDFFAWTDAPTPEPTPVDSASNSEGQSPRDHDPDRFGAARQESWYAAVGHTESDRLSDDVHLVESQASETYQRASHTSDTNDPDDKLMVEAQNLEDIQQEVRGSVGDKLDDMMRPGVEGFNPRESEECASDDMPDDVLLEAIWEFEAQQRDHIRNMTPSSTDSAKTRSSECNSISIDSPPKRFRHSLTRAPPQPIVLENEEACASSAFRP